MSKRGADVQGTKETGFRFDSGWDIQSGNMEQDAPKQATAAQMARRNRFAAVARVLVQAARQAVEEQLQAASATLSKPLPSTSAQRLLISSRRPTGTSLALHPPRRASRLRRHQDRSPSVVASSRTRARRSAVSARAREALLRHLASLLPNPRPSTSPLRHLSTNRRRKTSAARLSRARSLTSARLLLQHRLRPLSSRSRVR
ncbi:hypothetical protein BDY21DRAFT_126746 [Lineolata rhizophorae]|uniref:Uncharacterized protein n=1 Tax=Lineolata rhizophorae TaxID=578093 RepID=A0A6A6NP83_9PEZI|nr:hypothetical protein BDY21DRAFT_126746 [Lineolata rhizophorae]